MYLNKAMMVYGNSEVVPVYYCTFTIFSITGGALIYNELAGISVAQALMFGFGVLCAFFGVGVLMSGRSPEVPEQRAKGSAKKLRVPSSKELAGVAEDDEEEAKPGRPKPPPHLSTMQRIQRSAQSLSPTALKKSADTEVVLAFRDLDNDEKLMALETQSSSSALLCGGIGSSLQQATTETILAMDRSKALLQVQAANYPGSLQEARRMNRKGRLTEMSFMAALGERAVAAFAAMSVMELAGPMSQRVRSQGSDGNAVAAAADQQSSAAADQPGLNYSLPSA